MRKITVYVGNGEYVNTIEVEDDDSDDDIFAVALDAAMEWVDSTIYWEQEEE